ncbi:MAG: DUF3472 domain-containing protein [Ruminococcaceae bacterium]|jgi:hypothetical protein|nr:DUF3472 domain-containing protein [Oscillospiraceae bacterium]
MSEPPLSVPLGGCAFLESSSAGGVVTERGIANWHGADAVFGLYVSFVRPVRFRAALKLRPQSKSSRLRLEAGGIAREAEVAPGTAEVVFGEYEASAPGYLHLSLSGIEKSGNLFASPSELILYGIGPEDAAGFVPTAEHENYYWTRRGASVHATYDTKDAGDVEWFYHEAVVPEGKDPVGTYAMAIGFDGGYFGIQTNSQTERRILFSVWSPHVTDDPSSIPENRRVVCLSKNARTHVGEFGGEGAGGQSYAVYDWKSGVRHRFLMRVSPDGTGRCVFTAYFFFPDSGRFEEIASFLRPETDTWLLSPHCFLENFHDANGYLPRQAVFSNPWARTKEGRWFTPRRLRFTGDATARRGWRLDYGGAFDEEGAFVLKNGGFFNGDTPLGTVFDRPRLPALPPDLEPFVLSRTL